MYTNACECALSLACACHNHRVVIHSYCRRGSWQAELWVWQVSAKLSSVSARLRWWLQAHLLVWLEKTPRRAAFRTKDSNSVNVCFYSEPCSLTEGSEAKRSNRYLFQSICTLFLTSTWYMFSRRVRWTRFGGALSKRCGRTAWSVLPHWGYS